MQEEKVNKIDRIYVRGANEATPEDGSPWTGYLSSSAISTSVAVFALHMYDQEKYQSFMKWCDLAKKYHAGRWLLGR